MTMDTVPPGNASGRPGTMAAKASVEFRPRGILLDGMLNLIRPASANNSAGQKGAHKYMTLR